MQRDSPTRRQRSSARRASPYEERSQRELTLGLDNVALGTPSHQARQPPKSRLAFNDPFAVPAVPDEDSADSSEEEDGAFPAAEEQRLIFERADDTLQRLLREGVWSEPALPAQPLGASWRLPGQARIPGTGCATPALQAAPQAAPSSPVALRLCSYDDGDAEESVAQLLPPAQPRSAWLAAKEAPRRAPRTLAPGTTVRTELRLFVGTWNMHGKPPPASLAPWLPVRPAESHDILVVGTQEACRTIEASLLLPSKAKWEAALGAALGDGVVRIASHTLAALHVAVYVRRPLLPLLSHVRTAQVPCGVGNRLGNKGAVAASLCVGGTSLLFVNAHLAAHQRHVAQRNADVRRIEGALPLRPPAAASSSSCSSSSFSPTPASYAATPRAARSTRSQSAAVLVGGAASAAGGEGGGAGGAGGASGRFDRAFFFGDLNYRIDLRREEADALLAEPPTAQHDWPRRRAALLAQDQLRRQMAAREAFGEFTEADLGFRPTYKFDKHDKSVYDLSPKRRIPAWTDRVLSRGGGVTCTRYESCEGLRTSDHLPVLAEYIVQCACDAQLLQAVLADNGVPWP